MLNRHLNSIVRSLFSLGLIAGWAVISYGNSAPLVTVGPFGDIWQMASGEPDEASGDVQITLRDSVTGGLVAGRITSISKDDRVSMFLTGAVGRGVYRPSVGRNDLEIAAPGYGILKTFFEVGLEPMDITVWLDPLEPPLEMRPAVIESDLQAGLTLIHGHIIDVKSGKPLAGARVYLQATKLETLSDANGYFRMRPPTPSVDPAGDLPGTDNLVVESGGEMIYRRNNTMLPAGAVHFIVDIDRDIGVIKDGIHKLHRNREELKNDQTAPSQSPKVQTDIDIKSFQNEANGPLSVTVPSSIRVGFSCPTRSTCSTFQVYTLDTYTRLGLDDEWISSWNANSLKAGAIAFRSYGVYHIFHPLNANYDICNTTSCQVIDPADSAVSTDNATAQTSGSIVVDSTGNSSFFAEYSAENNNGGCGDGLTGNNTTWPCINDIVDAGTTFNGHGRGMCQWGSQRWSINQGKDFVWIVAHYYNNNGAPAGLRAGYLQLGAATALPPPALAMPGTATAPGTAVGSLTPTFEWQAMDGADGYALYISRFNGSTYDLIFNSETVVGAPITGTSYTLPSGFLQVNGQYRWNMSSHNAAGYGTANTFRNYFFVSPPVTVSGRVTTPDGRGLRNAIVALTDSQGVRQTATTSSFGLYTITGVRSGEQYAIGVNTKRYRFTPQNLNITDSLANVDFVGLE